MKSKFLANLGEYIREQVVGSSHFDPTWGIAITWENVTSSRITEDGPCEGTMQNPCPVCYLCLFFLTVTLIFLMG